MTDTPTPRWFSATGDGHSQWYIERFRTMAAEGVDLAGEARFLDAIVAPGSRILDAGCGPGRLGAELHRRGHTVVGVDVDPELIEAAGVDHPGPTWINADLATLDLPALGIDEPFDAALCAGNVMPFLAAGTGADVLTNLRAHVRPDGPLAIGFATDREYSLSQFDADAATAGLTREHRFATWDLRPWDDAASFAVTVLRVPAT
ncbi:class I SAM-dependent methyltransferase [Solicola gregarius]|uniref:Class I SAM-dependent methyltransferase n=1 Tax=Solicola gregarius TaxID=2908642 RepID=A0AA46TEB1_9ACTN|nr:class I SAM-dependent methyltransferase [Solicola gregarius]UYM03560.1 class I SAM-dependent methyltransferase [Solicola gregarius]